MEDWARCQLAERYYVKWVIKICMLTNKSQLAIVKYIFKFSINPNVIEPKGYVRWVITKTDKINSQEIVCRTKNGLESSFQRLLLFQQVLQEVGLTFKQLGKFPKMLWKVSKAAVPQVFAPYFDDFSWFVCWNFLVKVRFRKMFRFTIRTTYIICHIWVVWNLCYIVA